MKICKECNSVPFESVSPGEVFIYEDSVYMKINPLTLNDGTIIDAITLASGYAYSFSDDYAFDDVQVVPDAVLKLYND